MVDLKEILMGYFSFREDKHEEFERQLALFYGHKDTRITRISSEKYKLKLRLGHVWEYKGKTEIAEYCGDREIVKETSKKCLNPLHFIPDCNYMYYGCYLSIAAFLMNIEPKRLLLFHGPGDNFVYSFKYRPQVAQIFLSNRLKGLRAMKAEPVKEIPEFKAHIFA